MSCYTSYVPQADRFGYACGTGRGQINNINYANYVCADFCTIDKTRQQIVRWPSITPYGLRFLLMSVLESN